MTWFPSTTGEEKIRVESVVGDGGCSGRPVNWFFQTSAPVPALTAYRV
jgi:hypothetical protein